VRRIEAVAGPAVLEYLQRDRIVRELSDRFKAKPEELPGYWFAKRTQNHSEATGNPQGAVAKSEALLTTAESVGDYKILVAQLEDVDPESLRQQLKIAAKLDNGAVLGSVPEAGKVSLVAAFSPAINKKVTGGKIYRCDR